jgi:hypothetical protein
MFRNWHKRGAATWVPGIGDRSKYRVRSENRGHGEYFFSILKFSSLVLPFSSVLLVSDRTDAIVILCKFSGGSPPKIISAFAAEKPVSQGLRFRIFSNFSAD